MPRQGTVFKFKKKGLILKGYLIKLSNLLRATSFLMIKLFGLFMLNLSQKNQKKMAGRNKRGKSRGSAGNNRKAGEDFLIKNRKKEGVVETDTGLQYLVLDEGKGSKPDENAIITVHQRCQLVNGTIIEDTYRKNEPSEVKMEELIEGYQEGVQLMCIGARYKFFVPSDLAWGKNGTGNKIPPYSVLIFDVRLLEIRKE